MLRRATRRTTNRHALAVAALCGLTMSVLGAARALSAPDTPSGLFHGAAAAASGHAVRLDLAPASAPTAVSLNGMPSFNPSTVAARAAGAGQVQIDQVPIQLSSAHDLVGAFRTRCDQSHMAADDPIVKPGQPGASHLHTFFGNTGVDAYSTADSIATTGNSTCHGGIANRSSYWVPSLIDTSNGAVLNSDYLLVYYKSGYSGVSPAQINSIPQGLRIVAGSMRATPENPQNIPAGGIQYPAAWSCGDSGGITQAIPATCGPGSDLVMEIVFPQCWDGRNLDSADHKSHMAYGVWGPNAGGPGLGCPTDHPVAIPEITYKVHYTVPAGGPAPLRLSSDMYTGGAGGYSGHADWVNGWDQGFEDLWINNCVRAIDCQVDFLGDGRRLD